MPGRKRELIELLKKYRLGTASPEEVAFLEKYYQYFDKEEKILHPLPEPEKNELKEKLFSAIQLKIYERPVVSMYRRPWFRLGAAASIALLIGVGIYLFYPNKSQPDTTPPIAVKTNDVKAPASNRATITLSSGQVVHLDSVQNGVIAQQGNVSLEKQADGKIVYSQSSIDNGELKYNTLTNPRGSKVIDMALSDGSHVWLNAGSSMIYPISFIGDERKVTITGEAYFEVAHNASKPFKVSKDEMEVTVLGTHFNVNAYDDEKDIRVTLLEGSVKMSIVNRQWSILKPGEQGITTDDGKLKIEKRVDVDAVMAWKNGRFEFKSTDLSSIMRQVSRWYDVEIVFEADVRNERFSGGIARQENASQVMHMLELTNTVHFTIEGNKIVVRK